MAILELSVLIIKEMDVLDIQELYMLVIQGLNVQERETAKEKD